MAAAQTGKRYFCPSCGAEFIVTRGGEAELKCGDTPLEEKKYRFQPQAADDGRLRTNGSSQDGSPTG